MYILCVWVILYLGTIYKLTISIFAFNYFYYRLAGKCISYCLLVTNYR